jgi:hypothetical protein
MQVKGVNAYSMSVKGGYVVNAKLRLIKVKTGKTG